MPAIITSTINVNTLGDLKAMPVAPDTLILLVGRDTLGDGKGGFYRWDAASTVAEDLTYMNAIVKTGVATGRWVRIFARIRSVPQGTVETNGSVKTLYATVTTNSTGDATLYLTEDNTATGTPIFAEVWFDDSRSDVAATSAANAVVTYRKSLSTDLKTLVHGAARGNAITLTLGTLYAPFASVGAGLALRFQVKGI